MKLAMRRTSKARQARASLEISRLISLRQGKRGLGRESYPGLGLGFRVCGLQNEFIGFFSTLMRRISIRQASIPALG